MEPPNTTEDEPEATVETHEDESEWMEHSDAVWSQLVKKVLEYDDQNEGSFQEVVEWCRKHKKALQEDLRLYRKAAGGFWDFYISYYEECLADLEAALDLLTADKVDGRALANLQKEILESKARRVEDSDYYEGYYTIRSFLGSLQELEDGKLLLQLDTLVKKISIEAGQEWGVLMDHMAKIRGALAEFDSEKIVEAKFKVLDSFRTTKFPKSFAQEIAKSKEACEKSGSLSANLRDLLEKMIKNCELKWIWEEVANFFEMHKDKLGKVFDTWYVEGKFFDILLRRRAPKEVLLPILEVMLVGADFEDQWELLLYGAKYSIPLEAFDLLTQWKEKPEVSGHNREKLGYDECPFKQVCGIQSKKAAKDYAVIDLLIERFIAGFVGYDPFWATVFHEEITDDVLLHILKKCADDNNKVTHTPRDLTALQTALQLEHRSGEIAAFLLQGPDNKLQELSPSTMSILAKQTAASQALQKVFNSKIVERGPTATLFLEFYCTVLLVCFFVIMTMKFFDADFLDGFVDETLYIGILACNSYFAWRESLQVYVNGLNYIWDPWNSFEVGRIVFVFLSVYFMKTQPEGDAVSSLVRIIIMLTGFFVIVGLILFLRTTFLPFGTFVGGLILIFKTLIPFLVVSVLTLFTFSFMYYALDFDSSACEEDGFCSLTDAMLTSLAGFFSGPDSTALWVLDISFGFVVVVVLLNVVIAIVCDAWETGTKLAGEWFWTYRISFLADFETTSISTIAGFLFGSDSSDEIDSIRYIRFDTTRTRDPRNNGVQLAGIRFYNIFDKEIPIKEASNPEGGWSYVTCGPENVIDGNPDTKWYDGNEAPLLFKLERRIPVDDLFYYTLTTANDSVGRDPVGWKLEGAKTLDKWRVLDDRRNNQQDIPFERCQTSDRFIATGDQNTISYTLTYAMSYISKTSNQILNDILTCCWRSRSDREVGLQTEESALLSPRSRDEIDLETRARLLRFTTKKTRDPHSDGVQLSEMYFYDNFGRYLQIQSAINPDGQNPENEGPECLYDGAYASKWADLKIAPLILQLREPIDIAKIASYKFCTAGDCQGRDPIRWTLEWSAQKDLTNSYDIIDWKMLDDRSNKDQTIPQERQEASAKFSIPGLSMCSFLLKYLSTWNWLLHHIDALGERTILDSINWSLNPYREMEHNDELYLAYTKTVKPDRINHWHAKELSDDDYGKLCCVASFERDWIVACRDRKHPYLRPLRVLFLFIGYCLCILLGFFTAGILWPRGIREALFSFTTEDSDDGPVALSVNDLNEIRREIVDKVAQANIKLEEKMVKANSDSLTALEKRVSALEEKMEKKLDLILEALAKK